MTRTGPSAWQRLAPGRPDRDEPLSAIDAYLDEPSTAAALDALELSGRYPSEVLRELRARGLAELFLPALATSPRLSALNVLTARRSGSLAITVGVNSLALLPVYIAGDPAQCDVVTGRLRAGASASMLLTEWEHGSNLLRNEASARPDGGGYRLTGIKHLINGGTEHQLLVSLMRTRSGAAAASPLAGRGDFSLFLVERDATIEALERWSTVPTRAADIAGVRFHDTRVPAGALIGAEGEGFTIVQKALMISRGGIGALAAGAVTGALDVAVGYARERDVYGAPIVTLGAVAEHLMRMAALEVVVAAASVRATYASNLLGPAAAYFTAVAKYACARLAEEAVTEGRLVLGSRALLETMPYARFVRDVLLYGVFDGTSHLMLDELSWRLARSGSARAEPSLAKTAQIYTAPARPIVEVARQRSRPYAPPLAARCAELAAASGEGGVGTLAGLARALDALTAAAQATGRWQDDQALRFEAAALLAELEALLAGYELVAPGCRAALGLAGEPAPADVAALAYALDWLGGRAAGRLRDLARRVDDADIGALPLPGDGARVRQLLRDHLVGGAKPHPAGAAEPDTLVAAR